MGVAEGRIDETARLIARSQAGDELAFTHLYRAHIARVNAYLRAALHEESDVQDVAQRVFEAVFEALPAYRADGGRFDNWLLRIVRNQAIDHVRKYRRASPRDPEAMSHLCEQHDLRERRAAVSWGSSERLHQHLQELPE